MGAEYGAPVEVVVTIGAKVGVAVDPGSGCGSFSSHMQPLFVPSSFFKPYDGSLSYAAPPPSSSSL